MAQVTIEPTPHFFMAGPVMVRMWTGHDNAGLPVVALVSAILVGTGDVGETATAMGLVEIPPPSPEDAERWAKNILGGRVVQGEWQDDG